MRLRPTRAPAHELTTHAGLAGAALLAMARFWPFDRLPLVTCPLRRLAGIPCPTCGMTRAFVHLTHGELGAAFHVSPLGALLALATSAFVLQLAARFVLRRGLALELAERERRIATIAIVLLVVVNWSYLLVTRAAG